MGKYFFDFSTFDNFAVAHDADGFGIVFRQTQIVGNEDNRHAHLLLQIVEQIENLGLNGYIQSGGRLIGNQQVGFIDERHGNHDALQLAAGKLVRILFHAAFGFFDAHTLQQCQCLQPCFFAAELFIVHTRRFNQLRTDTHKRIERGHRLLENHADAVAAQITQGFLIGIQNGNAVKSNARIFAITGKLFRQQAHNGHRCYRLARAGLADQSQCFALCHFKADITHGVHVFFMQFKIDVQIFYNQ